MCSSLHPPSFHASATSSLQELTMPPLTRSKARVDPTHDRQVTSKATASHKAKSDVHPYEWLTSPFVSLQDFNNVWRAMFNHKDFDTCNTHLSQAEKNALKHNLNKRAFTRLGDKPLFSPYALSGSNYSQVHVEGGSELRVSAHVFAVVYRLRFLEEGAKRMDVGALKHMLEMTGTHHAHEASHLCSNFKGSGHNCNPYHITLEPLEINQSRRTCHLRWALNQYLVNQPPTSSTAATTTKPTLVTRFYEEGDRCPPLEGSTTHNVDKTTPWCCQDLHEPPCIAYYGPIPATIKERVITEEQALVTRKTRRVAELQEKKRKEEEERVIKKRLITHK